MVEEHPSGESFVERPTKEDLHQKKGVIFCKADRRLRKTPLFERADEQLKALELQEAEHQTDNGKVEDAHHRPQQH